MLYHIVAMARNRAIGKDNKLPWHFPSDLKHFKRRTTGSTVIMGRKTYDSIGKPLPNRENFVLSRTKYPDAEHLRFFTSLEEALKNVKTPDAYIIGGAELFQQTMNKVDGIYLTRIDADFEGDTFYPEIPENFEEIEIEHLQDNPTIEVVLYHRKEKHTDDGTPLP
jgi:dihydrofolate reductase